MASVLAAAMIVTWSSPSDDVRGGAGQRLSEQSSGETAVARSSITAPVPLGGSDAEAVAARLEGDGERTRFRLSLTQGVTAEIFTLANPYRVIIDLPNVSFRLGEDTGRTGQGLVKAFRYGLFAEGKARIVIDATGPVRIDKAAMAAAGDTSGRHELEIELASVSPEDFGAGTGASKLKQPPKTPAPPAGAKTPGKPVVVIDPGHGGIDGGAVGLSGEAEKTVVMAVAKELSRELGTRGGYDVRLTRSNDVFVSLDRRVEISREAGADLFISLHADSLADTQFAGSVRGATVYTLSGRASNEEARRMAEKENASDLLAGIEIGDDEESGDVKGILIDLIKRETANFSADFSNVLTPRLAKAIPLARDPQRSAAFKVLKQTHAPSVLIELGYMSHAEDQKLLTTAEWQRRAAQSIAGAVDQYFSKRTARTP